MSEPVIPYKHTLTETPVVVKPKILIPVVLHLPTEVTSKATEMAREAGFPHISGFLRWFLEKQLNVHTDWKAPAMRPTTLEARVLAEIKNTTNATSAGLARTLSKTQSNMSMLVSRLEAKGWVVRDRNDLVVKRDGRPGFRIKLTPLGEKTLITGARPPPETGMSRLTQQAQLEPDDPVLLVAPDLIGYAEGDWLRAAIAAVKRCQCGREKMNEMLGAERLRLYNEATGDPTSPVWVEAFEQIKREGFPEARYA